MMESEKKAYAEALLRNPNDIFKAALSLFPENPGRCLQIADQWTLDPEVIKYKQDLITEFGYDYFLPQKHDSARLLWSIITSNTATNVEKINAHKEYNELMGFKSVGASGKGITVYITENDANI